MKKLFKLLNFYFKIWKKYTINSFTTYLESRFSVIIFILGKLLRLIFFLLFLLLLVSKTKSLGGFTIYQMALFYLTFNLIDTLTQLLFREVYRFRSLIIEGRFDYILIQPINSLFRSLTGGADLLDVFMLIPIIGGIIYMFINIPGLNPCSVVAYLLLVINSLIIAASFHIFVLSIGVMTTAVDHTIMIYRDISSMGRIPIDIYKEPLRAFLTFIIPIGIMMTFPAKALFGLLSPIYIVISLGISLIFFYLSIKLWRYSLTKYSSASS